MALFLRDALSSPLNADVCFRFPATNKCRWWSYTASAGNYDALRFCNKGFLIYQTSNYYSGLGVVSQALFGDTLMHGLFTDSGGGVINCNTTYNSGDNTYIHRAPYSDSCYCEIGGTSYTQEVASISCPGGYPTYGLYLHIRPWMALALGLWSSSIAIDLYYSEFVASFTPTIRVVPCLFLCQYNDYSGSVYPMSEPATIQQTFSATPTINSGDSCSTIMSSKTIHKVLTIYDDGTFTLI